MLATGSSLQSQQRCLPYVELHCSSSSVSENSRIGLNYHVKGSLCSEYVPRRNLVKQGLVHGRRAGLEFTQKCSTSGTVGLYPQSDSSTNGAVAIPEEPHYLDVHGPEERVGVLLLNLGGPEKLEDVGPFLYNLFADPDIIRLPRLFRFLQKPLAKLISTLRAPTSSVGYAAIGGGSPLRRITDEQAVALKKEMEFKGLSARVYVGMRYWYPFTEEAIEKIKADKITRLVILPLYPQFSISTSGSSLRLLETIFRNDEYLSKMKHTVIPSWYHRRGYLKSMSTLIRRELLKFDNPQEVRIFFSAHGVPTSYVEKAGDPYKSEMEECVDFIMDELRHEGVNCERTLAYQSRVGPIEWLKPYTDETIKELGRKGTKSLLVVPISFVSEHIETLEEIDMEYKELALESGIQNWHRVPALGCEPTFIADLADAVIESLPFVGPLTPSSHQQVYHQSS